MSAAAEPQHVSAWVQNQLQALLGTSVEAIRTTPDRRIAVVDVARAITGSDAHLAAQTVRKLCEKYKDLLDRMTHIQFPGQGQRETPVTDARGIVEIILLLPGHHAALVRRQAAELLVRYLGGDVVLVDEVCALRAPDAALSCGRTVHLNTTGPTSDSVDSHGQKRMFDEISLVAQSVADQVGARLTRLVEKAIQQVHPWEFSHGARSHSALLEVGIIVDGEELVRLDKDEHVVRLVDFLKDRVAEDAWGACSGKIKSIFSIELKKAKLDACRESGVPPPIARMQGEYRIVYTEADNDLMIDVFNRCAKRIKGIATRDAALAKASQKKKKTTLQDYFLAPPGEPRPLAEGGLASNGTATTALFTCTRSRQPMIQSYFTRSHGAAGQHGNGHARACVCFELPMNCLKLADL